MEILKLLDKYFFVTKHEVIEAYSWDSGFYFNIKIYLTDSSTLFARDYFDWETTDRDYAFHWQDSTNKLIMRWDNTRHHKHLKTFPFPIHQPNKVIEGNCPVGICG